MYEVEGKLNDLYNKEGFYYLFEEIKAEVILLQENRRNFSLEKEEVRRLKSRAI
jgi:hypothetical protein